MSASIRQESLAGLDRARMHKAAEILLTARRALQPVENLPLELRPGTLAEAYFLQDVMAQAFGDPGGWKVGAPSPDAVPLCSAMPLGWMGKSGVRIAGTGRRMRGLEAEICFLLGKDLPIRPAPYTREELEDAIVSCHPAIELLESALTDPDKADRLTVLGDLLVHGGFVYGDAVPGWKEFDFSSEEAELTVDGMVRVQGGKNPVGPDLLRLIQWLANEGQFRTGGLLAGQWITTGSWTGKVLADRGSNVAARFSHFGSVILSFE